jgi:hypothetical protein
VEPSESDAAPPVGGPIATICPECGELIEVKDPAALIRALHMVNACALRALMTGAD